MPWPTHDQCGWIIDPGYWDNANGRKDIDASNHVSRNTGILNHQGRRIYKEPNPVGFGRPQGQYYTKD